MKFSFTSAVCPPGNSDSIALVATGRDVLSGIVYGARTSLEVGFLSVILSATLGIAIGAVAGFYGGRLDDLMMRTTEVFQVMPRFFLALVIVANQALNPEHAGETLAARHRRMPLWLHRPPPQGGKVRAVDLARRFATWNGAVGPVRDNVLFLFYSQSRVVGQLEK